MEFCSSTHLRVLLCNRRPRSTSNTFVLLMTPPCCFDFLAGSLERLCTKGLLTFSKSICIPGFSTLRDTLMSSSAHRLVFFREASVLLPALLRNLLLAQYRAAASHLFYAHMPTLHFTLFTFRGSANVFFPCNEHTSPLRSDSMGGLYLRTPRLEDLYMYIQTRCG